MRGRLLATALLWVALSGCQDEDITRVPDAVAMTRDAVGHYCQMHVLEHDGPKAQVHLARLQHPLWFTQVRDAIAYLQLPEETAEVAAVYVHDMGRAESWENPGAENWIAADNAHYVIDSRRSGGMGAPEAVPFGTRDAAELFAAAQGGRVVQLAEIPDAYVLGPVEVSAQTADLEDATQ